MSVTNWKFPGIIFAFFCIASLSVLAYNSAARDSLLRSRDQVADQRHQLERTYAELDKKIADLQQQKYTVGRYLADCDQTIRDLDRALSAQDSAYGGR
jgi:septal ring factor EnvC (AmiA/AmiB activator)